MNADPTEEVYDYVRSRELNVFGVGPFQASTSEHLNSESHASPAAVAPWKSQVAVYSPGRVLGLVLELESFNASVVCSGA